VDQDHPLDVAFSTDDLFEMHRRMLVIRGFEERVSRSPN
jgi:TPP-dependent pyruvate/acetoin dehydrogenase alpha subunit